MPFSNRSTPNAEARRRSMQPLTSSTSLARKCFHFRLSAGRISCSSLSWVVVAVSQTVVSAEGTLSKIRQSALGGPPGCRRRPCRAESTRALAMLSLSLCFPLKSNMVTTKYDSQSPGCPWGSPSAHRTRSDSFSHPCPDARRRRP